MENSPRNTSEEDKAAAAKAEALEDDDDDEEKEEKEEKPTPRSAPGVALEKVKEDKNEKPRISITDRLLESIGAKPESHKNKEKDQLPDPEQVDSRKESEMDTVEGTNLEVPLENEAAIPDTLHNAVQTKIPEPEATSDSADWESAVVGTNLETTTVPASSGEVTLEVGHEDEDFAEIPAAPKPEGDVPEVETGPVEPELIENGLESEGPPDPPETDPPTRGGVEEPPESTPSYAYRHSRGSSGYGGSSPWYSAAAADKDRARELSDAELDGQRYGVRRGLWTGLLFGWLIGRHGKKKQGKVLHKALKVKDKEIKSLKTEQNAAAFRLDALKRSQEQLEDNIRQNKEKPPVAPVNPLQKLHEVPTPNPNRVLPPKSVQERLVNKVVEVLPVNSHTSSETLIVSNRNIETSPETREVATVAAALTAVERSIRSDISRDSYQLPEDQEISQDIYEVKQDSRVETSAWHRIEVDEKTGKPVENPEVAYGEEFRREKAKEVFSDDYVAPSAGETEKEEEYKKRADSHYRQPGSSVGLPASQLGGLAAASFQANHSEDDGYSHKPQESGLGANLPYLKQVKNPKHNSLLRFVNSPVVWVVAAIIVVVLFVLGILR